MSLKCWHGFCIVAAVLLLELHYSEGEGLQFLGEQPFRAYASRSTTIGQVLYQLIAINSSNGDSTGITYAIQQGLTDTSSSHHFMMRPETGEFVLSFLLSSLVEHTLVLEAQSGSQIIQTNLIVTVLAESDLAPRYEQERYNLSLCENYTVQQPFTVVRAFPLSPVMSQTYSIASDTSGGNFDINSTNGLLALTRPLDREQVNRYFLIIRFSFSGGFIDTNMEIRVLDTNDNAPHFERLIYNTSIPENAVVSSSVLTISAVDPDFGSNGMIRYSLEPSAPSEFSLDPVTGLLTVSSELDFEQVGHYEFTITASDGGSPASSSTVVVVVNILNVDDKCPIFENPLYIVNIPAAQLRMNSLILRVKARDPDGFSSIRYAIASRTDASSLSFNQTTGEVTVADETNLSGQYSLNVSASDANCETFVLVKIRITDDNFHSPIFSTLCDATLTENPPVGTQVVTLTATDADRGVSGQVSYSLLNTSLFSIDAGTGVVRTNQDPSSYDRETQQVFQVGVVASDGGLKQDYCLLTVTLLDQNDNPPIFVLSLYSLTLSVNTPPLSLVATTIAFDADVGDNGDIRYSLTHPLQQSPPLFAIDPVTADITTTALMNVALQSFVLNVMATDMGEPMNLSSSAMINISLVPASATFPVFNQSYYNITMCENVPVNFPVLTLNATSRPTYQLVAGLDYSSNSESVFSLSGTSATITVGSMELVDYELLNSRKSFLFPVLASNSDGRSFTTVEIFVTDLDDNSPMVDSGYSFTLAENQPIGFTVTQILSHDPDSGPNGDIAYLTTSSLYFNISSTGQVVSTHIFDFEDPSVSRNGVLDIELYNPNPRATPVELMDMCGFQAILGPTSRTFSVRWSILDQNDNPPSFNQSTSAVSVSEEQQVNTAIFNFGASDPDVSDRTSLSFLITEGNDGTFMVESNTLVLVRRLDFETRSSYNLSVLVTDGVHSGIGNTCPQCLTTIVVTVLNVDDEPPVFSAPTYQGEVVEMSAPGTSVLMISAHDIDTANVGYRLSGPAQGRFSVSDSGDIIVSGPLDREEFPSGVVSFLAYAEGGRVATARVDVTLLDINDQFPRFLEIFSGYIVENTDPGGEGISIVWVTAQDLDEGRNGTLNYTLVDGMENGFRIDSNSGIITAHAVYDREAVPTYFLTVQATDDGVPEQLFSTTLVTVTIGDENDNQPFFPFPFMFAQIFEGAEFGSHVLDVPVDDSDENLIANFTLLSSSLPDKYSLNSDTGEVMVAGVLDFEIPLHREIMLTISIHDPQFMEVTEGVLSINLIDRNDNAPRVDLPTYNSVILGSSLIIPENLPTGLHLATITAFDEDEGSNGELVFSIVSGDDRNDFNISSSGRVTNARILDYEVTNMYNLLVSVSDRGNPPLSSSVQLVFNVQDTNDNAPSFSQPVYSVSVGENLPAMDNILQVMATDPDSNIAGLIGSYGIVSGNSGTSFTLNSTTGILSTNVEFDREERDSYTLIITASDRGASSQTGTGMVEVAISDVNDNPSQPGGLLLVFIYSGGGLVQPGAIGPVYFPDPDTSNSFQACSMEQTFFDIFTVSEGDCILSLLQVNVDEGTYPFTVTGNDGVHTSVTTRVIIMVEHIASESFPEESLVTLTINATAREYYGEGLNVSLPTLFAQFMGVERRNVYIVSLQPGYHDPLNTIDMTLSVMLASGDLMAPVEVLNQLFLSRDSLFAGGRGIVALPTDPCVNEPCSNHAKCTATRTIGPTQQAISASEYILLAPLVTLGYECECVPGTAGDSCEINYDDCYSNPCMYSAKCTDGVQGFVCSCPEGTSGPDCSFNPDECSNNQCRNNAQCINGFNTYICDCLPGYYGSECQYAHFQVSPNCNSDPCLNEATCSPGRDGFTCLCPAGFDGTLCEDDNVQVQGGCVGNPCYNGSTCMDTSTGPICQCSVGFTGPLCRWPLNNCELKPCKNGATCEAGLYGSYLCTCAPGYTGENCTQRVLACESNPCLNGGRCMDNSEDGSFHCQCTRNYTGLRCDIPLIPPNLCEPPGPCSSFSNCTSGTDGITCSCSPGYHSPDCSIMSDTLPNPCSSNPCQYGGSCTPGPPNEYTCLCSSGFTGTNCETNIDDCTPEPCLNAGTCQDGIGGFICHCNDGITGDVCQVFCPDGQEGEFCEVSMSQCSFSSCLNGGTCIEIVGGFECQCPGTHTGQRCEVASSCNTTFCSNGGMCSDLGAEEGVVCRCVSGFDGPNCQLLTASFTGSSTQSSFRAFRPLQLQGQGRVALEFATRSQQGLLLFSTHYQGGTSRDSLVAEVVGGHLRVGLALGSGAGNLVVMGNSVHVSDGRWHQVSIETNGKSFEVLLDQCQVLERGLLALSECKSSAVTPGNNSYLDLGLPLWIGGVPFSTPPTTPHQVSSVGFTGCIRNVTINGETLDLEDYLEQRNSGRGCDEVDGSCSGSGGGGPCGAGMCVPVFGGFSCICPPQIAGDNCERSAESLMFSGESYAEYRLTTSNSQPRVRRQASPVLRSTLSDQLSFRFRTEFDSGILFHIGGLSSDEDFSYVELENGGTISYHINLGSGEETVYFPNQFPTVDDALWHYFQLERTALDLMLTLDDQMFSHTLGGNQIYLDVGYMQFYAGGLPVQGSRLDRSYTGCLEDIRVDNNVLPTSGSNKFATVTYRGNSSTGVSIGCALRGCFPDPCGGGRCTERGMTDFVCSCNDGSRLFSTPCSAPQQVTPYLLVIIAASVISGLLIFLVVISVGVICWKRCANRKLSLMLSEGISSSHSEMVLATRDCVVISNDAGGGEQDTTMTDEKWQQSVPIPRKETLKVSSSSTTSSELSIGKPEIVEETVSKQQLQQQLMVNDATNETFQARAKSPVISAFIDQRLEALRKEYPDHDSVRVFADEGECVSKVSLNSFCSYQSKEEQYTLERLKRAGPEFQRFAGLLEVLAADEDEVVDTESEVVHTGLTQTQTQSQGDSQTLPAGFYF